MEQYIMKMERITKRYKDKRVLDSVSVAIKKGKLFLYNEGQAKEATEKDMKKFRRNMGSLIEKPALYGTLSAWDNLYLHGEICGNTNKEYLRKLLKEINEKYNTTIIVSSHILSELYQFADEYIFMDYGKIVELIDHENLKNKIEAIDQSDSHPLVESGTLEEYFVNLIGESRKCELRN